MPTPYVPPPATLSEGLASRAGVSVVKLLSASAVTPEASAARALTRYAVPTASGAAGAHPAPSGVVLPGISRPSLSVTWTAVSVPPVTETRSAPGATPAAPFLGVMSSTAAETSGCGCADVRAAAAGAPPPAIAACAAPVPPPPPPPPPQAVVSTRTPPSTAAATPPRIRPPDLTVDFTADPLPRSPAPDRLPDRLHAASAGTVAPVSPALPRGRLRTPAAPTRVPPRTDSLRPGCAGPRPRRPETERPGPCGQGPGRRASEGRTGVTTCSSPSSSR